MPTQTINQQPNALNITLRQNQEWNLGFEYTNPDGSLINLTGYTPALQLRTTALAKTTALSLTVGNGIIFNPNSNPQVQISTTMNVAPGKYVWDLKLTATGQGALFLGQGTIIVEADVTQ